MSADDPGDKEDAKSDIAEFLVSKVSEKLGHLRGIERVSYNPTADVEGRAYRE